jgi:NTP pyrophosphatase (non-canonical NTP hydrolase)
MAENLQPEGGSHLTVYLPPELEALGCGPDLQRFFDAMVYKLRRNAHKGKWEDVPLDRAFQALRGETMELQQAIVTGSTSEILMEAADVANQALIAANIALEARGV